MERSQSRPMKEKEQCVESAARVCAKERLQ